MISVVSACRNEAAHIRSFLDSLLQQQRPPEDWEAVIADGLSNDGTREILQEYARKHPGRIRVIENPGKYVASGLNAAIRVTQGRIILRMDAHTRYAPDYLCTCVEILEQTGADNVGGPARTRVNGWLHKGIAVAYHSRFGCGGARFHNTEFEGWVDTVTYGCWRRETFERLGLFDESMIRNQDDELNLRLIRSGGRIWQSPRIVSWYSPRMSLLALFRQYFQYGFWKVAVIRKHRLPARWQHLVPGLLMLAQIVLPVSAAVSSVAGALSLFHLTIGVYAAINGTYFAASLLVSARLAAHEGWALLPALPLVFATYHTSYGLGFLWGSVQFGLLRHREGRIGRLATELTR